MNAVRVGTASPAGARPHPVEPGGAPSSFSVGREQPPEAGTGALQQSPPSPAAGTAPRPPSFCPHCGERHPGKCPKFKPDRCMFPLCNCPTYLNTPICQRRNPMAKGLERMRPPNPPPAMLDLIQQIRGQAAALIDLIDTAIAGDAEVERLKALAMTAIEEGSMWGIKATTRQQP